MARAKKTITVVYKNCWYGVYVNGNLIKKYGPPDSIKPILDILEAVAYASNISYVYATSPYSKEQPNLTSKLSDLTYDPLVESM